VFSCVLETPQKQPLQGQNDVGIWAGTPTTTSLESLFKKMNLGVVYTGFVDFS
jgi:hypothetical protein